MKPEDIKDALDRALDRDPRVKRTAMLDLCPCSVGTEIPVVWDRLIEMRQVFGTARSAVTYRPNRSLS